MRVACIALAFALATGPRGASADDTAAIDTAPSSSPAPAPDTSPGLTCADDELANRLGVLLRAERFADVHHAVVAARVLCKTDIEAARLLDAIALLRLEDRPAAYAELNLLAGTRVREPARIVLGWAYRLDGDIAASDSVLASVPAPRASAIRALTSLDDRGSFTRHVAPLAPTLRDQALALHARYEDADARSPALAGTLSALLPGSGQLYAGSLQAAAVTFVLNALFISATVEMVRRENYFTAAAAGTAASFFYVGGIMNAVDLARRRTERARAPLASSIETLLVPELAGSL